MILRYFARYLALPMIAYTMIGFSESEPLFAKSPSESIRLLGIAEIPGAATDLSGLEDILEQGVPHNQFGGISAIDFLGNDQYVLLPDRGPGDGANSYHCRFHIGKVTIDRNANPVVAFQLIRTTMLADQNGLPFSGAAKEVYADDISKSQRLDPEGIRVLDDGTLVISDEYGPRVDRFDMTGRWQSALSVPEAFVAAQTSADAETEASLNRVGRQPNGGLEGLAVTPSGHVFALIQRPLIQDSEDNPAEFDKRIGVCCRLIRFDHKQGTSAQFVYQLDATGLGQSALLAINDSEFLVFERDSKPGNQSKSKRIYKINIEGATDVSNVAGLPAGGVSGDITAVTKTLLIDMLDPSLHVPRDTVAGKIEGMAFGPQQPDGSHTLVVISDNDFKTKSPTMIYVFAIDKELLNR